LNQLGGAWAGGNNENGRLIPANLEKKKESEDGKEGEKSQLKLNQKQKFSQTGSVKYDGGGPEDIFINHPEGGIQKMGIECGPTIALRNKRL